MNTQIVSNRVKIDIAQMLIADIVYEPILVLSLEIKNLKSFPEKVKIKTGDKTHSELRLKKWRLNAPKL